MSLFSFHWNKNLIYVLIYWIINIFIRLSIYFGYEELFLISKNKTAQNEYIYIIYSVISNLLSGFLILYIKFVMRNRSIVQKKEKTKLIYKNPLNIRDKYFFLKLILISFIDLLHFSCYFIFFLIDKATHEQVSIKTEKDIKTLLDIIIRYIFSIFYLKMKLFKHHKWSIYAIIIGFILIVPIDLYQLYIKDINLETSLKYTAILSLRAFFFPFEHALMKKFFSNYYILPETILFSMGIIQTIFMSIFTPIFYFTKVLDDKLEFNTWKIVMSIIYTLISFVKQFITVKIVYLFSVQSVSFLIISTAIAGTIKDFVGFVLSEDRSKIEAYNYVGFAFGIIAFFIIVIGTMVYDEIIIVNKWGLNINVTKGIQERSLSEFESTIEDLEDDNELDKSGDLITNISIN